MRYEKPWRSIDEQHIKHFAYKYGDEHELPPYWMMMECVTMGTIEPLYSKATSQVRMAIAGELGVKARFSRTGSPCSASRGTPAAIIHERGTGHGA